MFFDWQAKLILIISENHKECVANVSEEVIEVLYSGDGLEGAIVGVPSNLGVLLRDGNGKELDMSKVKIVLVDPSGHPIAEQV